MGKDGEKTSWKERNVTLPAGLIGMALSAAISAGGVKIADNAWPTEVEVRLALIEQQQTANLAILTALAKHHGVDVALLKLTAPDNTKQGKGP
jgi:hypothetical protein